MLVKTLVLEGNNPRSWGEQHGEAYRSDIQALYEIRLALTLRSARLGLHAYFQIQRSMEWESRVDLNLEQFGEPVVGTELYQFMLSKTHGSPFSRRKRPTNNRNRPPTHDRYHSGGSSRCLWRMGLTRDHAQSRGQSWRDQSLHRGKHKPRQQQYLSQ